MSGYRGHAPVMEALGFLLLCAFALLAVGFVAGFLVGKLLA